MTRRVSVEIEDDDVGANSSDDLAARFAVEIDRAKVRRGATARTP